MRKSYIIILFFLLSTRSSFAQQASPVASTLQGNLQGSRENGVNIYKGIPYAKAPIGPLRWKSPQPPLKWKGIKKAYAFGPRAMQNKIYSDMVFRSDNVSEDCLYLNIWTPENTRKDKLPVLVYFHGGGFSAGDGSEPRYDGMSMAQNGIIMITVNYRMGIFGFFAHPELTRESKTKSSGNYGLLDQNAALKWVKANISAFGGDPEKVTIAGQSAGSTSVSLQMASPLSIGLFRAAIGESGSVLNMNPPPALNDVEKLGQTFLNSAGVKNLKELRHLDAGALLKLTTDQKSYFSVSVDGYFLPDDPIRIYSTGKQADVELLAGWNSAEVSYQYILGVNAPTTSNYQTALNKLYGKDWEAVFGFYPVKTDSEVAQVATRVASDRFAGFSTWKWIDLHGKTNGKRVYRYLFDQPKAKLKDEGNSDRSYGAAHSADIPYALGNLDTDITVKYSPEDRATSKLMQSYFLNFIKNLNPNGDGLPEWSGFQSSIPKVMVFGLQNKQEGEKSLKLYQFLDRIYYK